LTHFLSKTGVLIQNRKVAGQQMQVIHVKPSVIAIPTLRDFGRRFGGVGRAGQDFPLVRETLGTLLRCLPAPVGLDLRGNAVLLALFPFLRSEVQP
jgi:hypothetical protein